MTTLPSFEELMSTLGLDNSPRQANKSLSSPNHSPLQFPKCLSSPQLKASSLSSGNQESTNASRTRGSRYSPYSSLSSSRRGSVSSSQPTTVPDKGHSNSSPSARISGRIRIDTKLPPAVLDPNDLSANTPISAYARRKTPALSPTSPTFPADMDYRMTAPAPLSIPSLPLFYSRTTPSPPPAKPRARKSGLDIPHNSLSRRSSKSSLGSKTGISRRRGSKLSILSNLSGVKPSPQVAVV